MSEFASLTVFLTPFFKHTTHVYLTRKLFSTFERLDELWKLRSASIIKLLNDSGGVHHHPILAIARRFGIAKEHIRQLKSVSLHHSKSSGRICPLWQTVDNVELRTSIQRFKHEVDKFEFFLNRLLVNPTRLIEWPFEQRERNVFIIARVVDRLESWTRALCSEIEQLPIDQLSMEDFKKMSQEAEGPMAAFLHWAVLVSKTDNVFEGTIFELHREQGLNTPRKLKGTELRGSRWVYISFRARTYFNDQQIEVHAREAAADLGPDYHFIFRNCHGLCERLILRIEIPETRFGIFEGFLHTGIGINASGVLKRRCKEWKQWHNIRSGQDHPPLPVERTQVMSLASVTVKAARYMLVMLTIVARHIFNETDSHSVAWAYALLWGSVLYQADISSTQYPLIDFQTRDSAITIEQKRLLENKIDEIIEMSEAELEENFTKIVNEALAIRNTNPWTILWVHQG